MILCGLSIARLVRRMVSLSILLGRVLVSSLRMLLRMIPDVKKLLGRWVLGLSGGGGLRFGMLAFLVNLREVARFRSLGRIRCSGRLVM